jgi:ectoine hydroxylase-related dioxygenase (phytanoyl-CoA dioxygenase family)
LADQLKAAYVRDGVLRCRGFFTSKDVDEIRAAFEAYGSRRDQLPESDLTFEADGTTVRNFWRMDQHDPFFHALAIRPQLLRVVGTLVGGDPVVMGVESFNKPARLGSAVPPHQDNAYFCQRPADVLSVWIAIDPATKLNGAVEYWLGSHHQAKPHQPSGIRGNSFGLVDPSVTDRYEHLLGTVESGDVLIHHCRTIHSSRPNRSDRSRLSLVIVYRGAHTVTDDQMKYEYHRALGSL